MEIVTKAIRKVCSTRKGTKTPTLTIAGFSKVIDRLGLELDYRQGQFVVTTPDDSVTLGAVSNNCVNEFYIGRNGRERITRYNPASDEDPDSPLKDVTFDQWGELMLAVLTFARTPLAYRNNNPESKRIFRSLL